MVGADRGTNKVKDGADSFARSASGADVFAYTSASAPIRAHAISMPARVASVETGVQSALNERHRVAIVALITLLYVVFLGMMLYLSMGSASLGITSERRSNGEWIVTQVVPYGLGYDAGVRPGDIVVRIDGSPVNQISELPQKIDFSGVATLQVKKAGAASPEIEVTAKDRSGGSPLHRWAYALLSLIFVGVGTPVYIKAKQRSAGSAFYFFCITTAVALAIAPAAFLARGEVLAMMFVTIVIWAASFALFFFKFPVRVGGTKRKHALVISTLVGLGGCVLAAYAWVLAGHPDDYAWVQPLGYLYLASCVVAGFVSLGKMLLKERSPEIRQQLALLTGGTVLALGPSLLLYLLPMLLFQNFLLPMEISVLALGLMPMAFAYAITQHQLLGIRGFLRRSVIYVVMGMSVLLVFAGFAAVVRATMPHEWQSQELGLLAFGGFVFLIAISYSYAQRWVERVVDRFIYHDAYDYKQALLSFSAQLAAEQNLHVLADQLVERTCRMMNLSCGVLLLTVPDDGYIPPPPYSEMLDSKSPGDRTEDADRAGSATQGSLMAAAPGTARYISWRDHSIRVVASPAEGEMDLVPYAKYGECADWLIDGLQGELSQLGIKLHQPEQPTQVLYLRAGEMSKGIGGGGGKSDIYITGNLMRSEPGEPIRTFLGVPLWTRSRFAGVLCLGEKKSGERFTKDDLSLLSTLGSQAALAIYNAQLYEMREQALLDTITALAHAIEAKDNYTINHCENITERAVALAQALALPRQEVENIRLGSILHDVGKIGIPDAILNKPGKLTNEEYEIIKQHAAIGARIVQSVGALQGVVPIVRHHQERYDGSGYPDGLSGEAIPIGARIISVVDAYGAMTEDRIYRKAPGHDVAISELKKFAGKQFDPLVVDAFIRLLDDQPELASP